MGAPPLLHRAGAGWGLALLQAQQILCSAWGDRRQAVPKPRDAAWQQAGAGAACRRRCRRLWLLPVLPSQQAPQQSCDRPRPRAANRRATRQRSSSAPLSAPSATRHQQRRPTISQLSAPACLPLRRTTSSPSSRCPPPRTLSTSCCPRRSAARPPSCTMVRTGVCSPLGAPGGAALDGAGRAALCATAPGIAAPVQGAGPAGAGSRPGGGSSGRSGQQRLRPAGAHQGTLMRSPACPPPRPRARRRRSAAPHLPLIRPAGWAIQRIRQFYMRKVKFTQQNWHDKLTKILEDFPKARGLCVCVSVCVCARARSAGPLPPPPPPACRAAHCSGPRPQLAKRGGEMRTAAHPSALGCAHLLLRCPLAGPPLARPSLRLPC